MRAVSRVSLNTLLNGVGTESPLFRLRSRGIAAARHKLARHVMRWLADRTRTMAILQAVGLSDRASHLPRELSGGQMQRVAIARALMVEPKILVADEPTGNLDKATGESIIQLFKSLASEKGLAILLTTHNAAFGYEADRVITLEDGRVVKEETSAHSEVSGSPDLIDAH